MPPVASHALLADAIYHVAGGMIVIDFQNLPPPDLSGLNWYISVVLPALLLDRYVAWLHQAVLPHYLTCVVTLL
jgi:hypothetical protein